MTNKDECYSYIAQVLWHSTCVDVVLEKSELILKCSSMNYKLWLAVNWKKTTNQLKVKKKEGRNNKKSIAHS